MAAADDRLVGTNRQACHWLVNVRPLVSGRASRGHHGRSCASSADGEINRAGDHNAE